MRYAILAPKRYWDDDSGEFRRGEVLERNGGLAWVEDEETGESHWVPTFDIHDDQ